MPALASGPRQLQPLGYVNSIDPIRKMIETKEERRLLNHQRYMDLWETYEDKVRTHFQKKASKAHERIKEKAYHDQSRMLKAQPQTFKEALQSSNFLEPSTGQDLRTLSLA